MGIMLRCLRNQASSSLAALAIYVAIVQLDRTFLCEGKNDSSNLSGDTIFAGFPTATIASAQTTLAGGRNNTEARC